VDQQQQQQHGNKAKGLLCLKHPDDETSPDSNNSNNGSRKKLKLTKDQSASSEDIFKLHSTLNPVFIFLYPSFLTILLQIWMLIVNFMEIN